VSGVRCQLDWTGIEMAFNDLAIRWNRFAQSFLK